MSAQDFAVRGWRLKMVAELVTGQAVALELHATEVRILPLLEGQIAEVVGRRQALGNFHGIAHRIHRHILAQIPGKLERCCRVPVIGRAQAQRQCPRQFRIECVVTLGVTVDRLGQTGLLIGETHQHALQRLARAVTDGTAQGSRSRRCREGDEQGNPEQWELHYLGPLR